ncbi:MAG TPA: C2 family cysteine protease [Candidatus Obscuribacterales bacterium]
MTDRVAAVSDSRREKADSSEDNDRHERPLVDLDDMRAYKRHASSYGGAVAAEKRGAEESSDGSSLDLDKRSLVGLYGLHKDDGKYKLKEILSVPENQPQVKEWEDGSSLTVSRRGTGVLTLPDGSRVRLDRDEVASLKNDGHGHISVESDFARQTWQFDGMRLQEYSRWYDDGSGYTKRYESDGSMTEERREKEGDKYTIKRGADEHVEKITYPDGTSMQFQYDDGKVTSYTDRDGETWTRQGDSDEFKSNKRILGIIPKIRSGDVSVDHDTGAVEITDAGDNFKTIIQPDGSEKVEYPELDADRFDELLDKNWKRIDRNDDGFITKEEVDRAVVNPSFEGEDAQLVVALKKGFSALEGVDDAGIWERIWHDGMSREDLTKLPDVYRQVQEEKTYAEPVRDFVSRRFNEIDGDRDGQIEKDEVEDARDNERFSEQERDYLEHFEDHFDKFKGDSEGVSRDRLGAYTDVAFEGEEGELIANLDRWLDETAAAAERADRRLYGTSDPLDSITPSAINQGGIGDCYFLAAVGSLAEMNPQAIKDMIKDNGNGTYTVTFPGDRDNPITVAAPTDAEIALYVEGKEHGIWPAVLEKAYGEWKGDTTIPQEAADGGDTIDKGIEILTPHKADQTKISDFSEDEVGRMLEDYLDRGSPVVVSVFDNPEGARGGDLPTGHAYSVVDYDPASGQVTIRNPWGTGELKDENGEALDGKNDGVFTVSLEEFYERFEHISVIDT